MSRLVTIEDAKKIIIEQIEEKEDFTSLQKTLKDAHCFCGVCLRANLAILGGEEDESVS